MTLSIPAIKANNISFKSHRDHKDSEAEEVAKNAAGVGGAVVAGKSFERSTRLISGANKVVKEGGGAFKSAARTAKVLKSSLLLRIESFANKIGLNSLVKFVKGPVAAKICGVLGGILAVGVLFQDLTRTVSAAAGVVDNQS